MVVATVWPASVSASNTTCTTKAIAMPMRIWLDEISSMRRPRGSTGALGCASGAIRNASASARMILTRAGTTAAPKIGAMRNRPTARRNGQSTFCTSATRSGVATLSMVSADQRRDAFDELMGVAHHQLQHPRAGDEDRRDQHGELGDERERHLVDLRRRLDHADDQADGERGEQQRC